ncbi:bifunctional phosphoribosyl-AMP cyclohydrolase/phosphoribosyl-ATP diphosphatase HisIE [Stenotrophomonas sp. MMGLT7]|uniref:bifunctional phosphoribosyl-AMP cyclohydrolase/phosphoribosyl-ATP diphosphatase HisIE n=1 Tax=Stenotrophomonas sp. MMGLT7 TaxID=2901227 RepID=UPI001E4CFC69|nr:bifunctional phosphoribosyl-AMP cyclohydrolase/phosphoribosyl-ATP diphosphatase HisIE [Stenotrophomonas sp. MMGLT7]MCD7099483.1 bifunctional phosphoribosyl-AMP cyclohydrolase/phosphoribosyl-ATP diphosphatase HisIE [Stenotrophomonas sp. MMGLT7]
MSEPSSSGKDPAWPEAKDLDWAKGGGLLPVVVQDAATLRVLMLGYMDEAALAATRDSGKVTFYSRSKQRLWTKGESSGHFLEVVAVRADCDADTLLVTAHPHGPTCHTGRDSCFPQAPGTDANPPQQQPAHPRADISFLGTLDQLVAERERTRPFGSYTTQLFEQGVRRIAQKVGEEGVETALAGVAQDDPELLGEAADLLYHLIVLLRSRELSLGDAVAVLASRHR